MDITTATAIRPFFSFTVNDLQVYWEEDIEFDWHKGMSWQVRQRSSDSMAERILKKYPQFEGKVLEVSTKSHDINLGQALSAMNLVYIDEVTERAYPIENWFQAAKVFIDLDGREFGPYTELLTIQPREAKRYLNVHLDERAKDQYQFNNLFNIIQNELANTTMLSFTLNDKIYPLEPKSSFYDFLYVKALTQRQNSDLAKRIQSFEVFTDIEFNPRAGKVVRYNTQARSCAIFVGLAKRQLLDIAVEDIESFIDCVGYQNDVGHQAKLCFS